MLKIQRLHQLCVGLDHEPDRASAACAHTPSPAHPMRIRRHPEGRGSLRKAALENRARSAPGRRRRKKKGERAVGRRRDPLLPKDGCAPSWRRVRLINIIILQAARNVRIDEGHPRMAPRPVSRILHPTGVGTWESLAPLTPSRARRRPTPPDRGLAAARPARAIFALSLPAAPRRALRTWAKFQSLQGPVRP